MERHTTPPAADQHPLPAASTRYDERDALDGLSVGGVEPDARTAWTGPDARTDLHGTHAAAGSAGVSDRADVGIGDAAAGSTGSGRHRQLPRDRAPRRASGAHDQASRLPTARGSAVAVVAALLGVMVGVLAVALMAILMFTSGYVRAMPQAGAPSADDAASGASLRLLSGSGIAPSRVPAVEPAVVSDPVWSIAVRQGTSAEAPTETVESTGLRREASQGALHVASRAVPHAVPHAVAHAMVLVIHQMIPRAVNDLPTIVTNLRNWVMGILAAVATLFLTIGGVRYVMAGGDPGEIERAKMAFRSAAVGYVLAVIAPVVLTALKSIIGG